jgi:hypothetical protein
MKQERYAMSLLLLCSSEQSVISTGHYVASPHTHGNVASTHTNGNIASPHTHEGKDTPYDIAYTEDIAERQVHTQRDRTHTAQ